MFKFYKKLSLSLFVLINLNIAAAIAQSITYSAVNSDKLTQARLEKPSNIFNAVNSGAVVLLHTGGGCQNSQTRVYADALNNAGFYTLEPCLFNNENERSSSTVIYLPQVFGALKYLAQLPGVDKNKISILGGSYGAALAFVSATTWAYETHADKNFPPFVAHAPFYPGCWIYERFIKARVGRSDLPGNAYDRFTGAPVRIYSGGKDDYDSRDPKACETMIKTISPTNQQLFSLKFFPNATHKWDGPVSASFFDPLACKGRGCMNINTADSAITKEGIEDLLVFLANPISIKLN